MQLDIYARFKYVYTQIYLKMKMLSNGLKNKIQNSMIGVILILEENSVWKKNF